MLELFVMHSCPYCKKVMEYFDKNGIEYIKNDISVPQNYERLLKLGGKEQVPFLYYAEKDVRMYESDDIIEYTKREPK